MKTGMPRRTKKLLARIRFCTGQLNAQWSPDEEKYVAAYPNRQCYRFE